MEARSIPLHACPKRPIRNYELNKVKAQQYITTLPAKYQQIAQKAVDNVLYISMQGFDQELKAYVERLNVRLKASGYQNFSVGFVCGKSQQWVTGLALKDLQALPSSWFSLGDNQGTIILDVPKQECNVQGIKEDAIVLFDDASYSGHQLRDNIARIAKSVKKKIFIVTPYMTRKSD